MVNRVLIAGISAVAALAPVSAAASPEAPAAADACRAPRVGLSAPMQPEPWRSAVEALVREASVPGRPWSCPGGGVDVVAHAGGATLVVTTDDGRSASREVASPDEVVPLGEALLSKPIPAPPAPPAPARVEPAATASAANERPVPDATEHDAPRALVSLLVAPRYAGPTKIVWGGVTATAAVPFGRWVAGAWGRYDALTAPLESTTDTINEFCVGATAGRSFPVRGVDLRASLVPSIAVVTSSLGVTHGEETRVDGRIGLEARGALGLSKLLRAVVALDAELAPRELGSDGQRPTTDKDHAVPGGYPAFTLGLGLGMELTPR